MSGHDLNHGRCFDQCDECGCCGEHYVEVCPCQSTSCGCRDHRLFLVKVDS